MATTQELLIRASMHDGVSNGMRRIRGEVDSTDRSMKRLASNDAAMRRLTDSTGRFADTVGGYLAGAVKTGALALGGLGVAGTLFGLKTASGFEQSKIAFETLLGSQEKGEALFRRLQALNVKTPFDLPQIADATQLLLRFGVPAERVEKILKGLIDAASLSGKPAENLGRLALATGQVASQGRLLGQDARQLAESGINAYAVYAQATGKSIDSVRKLGEQGKLDAKTLLDAIANETNGLERFRGGAEKLSGTLFGQLSNLRDKVSYTLAGATSPLTGLIKSGVGEVNHYLDDVQKRMARFSPQLGRQWQAGDLGGVAKTIDRIVGAGGQLAPVLDPALKILRDLGKIAKQDLVPLGKDLLGGFTLGLKAMQPIVSWFADHPDQIRRGIEAVLLFVGVRKVTGALDGFNKSLRDLRTVVRDRGFWIALQRFLGWTSTNGGGTGVAIPTPTVPGKGRGGGGGGGVAVGGAGALAGWGIPGLMIAGDVALANWWTNSNRNPLHRRDQRRTAEFNKLMAQGRPEDALDTLPSFARGEARRRLQRQGGLPTPGSAGRAAFLKDHARDYPTLTKGAQQRFMNQGLLPYAWQNGGQDRVVIQVDARGAHDDIEAKVRAGVEKAIATGQQKHKERS